MLDAILLEMQGVPAVAIITAPFRDTARAMAASWNLPDYAFVETPHPIANLTDTELDERAEALVRPVLDLLGGLEGPPRPPGASRMVDSRRPL
ncbi:MAG: hypothetical protein WED01_01605 [Candidatus Rokuibacteriota bacterium]